MTSIVEALIKQGAPISLTLGPLTYRIKRVQSLEMLNAGAGTLLAARVPEVPDNSAAARAARKAPKPADLDTAATAAVQFSSGMVCAAVTGISGDGGATWQDVTIVLDPTKESAEAARLFVGNLLPGHAAKLYAAALAHSTDGEAAGEQIASFLGGADPDAARAGE